MKKLSTGIAGLDMLFLGGLQIEKGVHYKSDPNKDEGLVIVIKGAKGTGKPLLAMQLMHGISKSIHAQYSNIRKPKNLFYSINKRKEDLDDQYLDLIISRQIQRMIHNFRKEKFNSSSHREEPSSQRVTRQAILNFLFDPQNEGIDQKYRKECEQTLAAIGKDLSKLVCEGIIYYNTRTNALHITREYNGDDFKNLIAIRRYNNINAYCSDLENKEYNSFSSENEKEQKEFYLDLINADILGNDEEQEDAYNTYAKAPLKIFKDILESLEYKAENFEKEQSATNDSNIFPPYDVIVIDGFSQLSAKDLSALPYSHMLHIMKKIAKVVILVMDEKPEAYCNCDIMIEMRKGNAPEEEYMYHELQIVKSVFQVCVLGWHQYKKRDEGIEVFPSIHHLLSKRYYMSRRRQYIGQSIFENNFEQYLNIFMHNNAATNNRNRSENYLYPNSNSYYKHKENLNRKLNEYLFDQWINERTSFIKKEIDKNQILCDLLFQSTEPTINKPFGWEDHFSVTGIIGNPNSFKRYLALASAYNLAKQGVHTLFVLFDKNDLDMRRQMICPVYNQTCDESCFEQCLECTRKIHTFDIRMGCISAEEFFAVLQDQISFYCDTNNQENKAKWVHLVIDDLQKLDFSFPFLHSTKLFLSTLVSICHSNNVKLTILCDKNASLTQELCALADSLICIKREVEYENEIDLFIERGASNILPSLIIKYKIKDVLNMFKYDKKTNRFKIKSSSIDNNESKIIGSMKNYWRQSINVITNKDEE